MPKVAVLGCKHTTRDLIAGLLRRGVTLDHCITISPEKGEEQQVAGYYDLKPFLADHGIPCTVAHKYSLKSPEDEAAIGALGIDLLLVMGWQRLIPDWLLQSLTIGAFGMHGSSKPLPHGRGRSPLNWSLIQGKTEFYTHLFRYMPGVDDGPIAGVQRFWITPLDDCHTLHHKNLVAMLQLCSDALPGLLNGTLALTSQPTEGASYYPKRTAEDGVIHWEDSADAIYNLVRGITRPFPGAFGFIGDAKVTIWRAIPFDNLLTWPGDAGEVVEVFYDGTFVVKTGYGTLLVQEYDGTVQIGDKFTTGLPRKHWPNLPD